MSTFETYITIDCIGPTATGKTLIWQVKNKRSNEICGQVRWHGGFRKYVFFPTDGFLFDASCLEGIADFLNQSNAGHKK